MAQTIAIINQKGGVGKTTTVVNLAAYLSRANKNILVVDLDPQGNATSGLGIDKSKIETSTYDLILGAAPVAEVMLYTPWADISLIPANQNLAAAEVDLAGVEKREYYLKESLRGLDHDYILIDCPPSLGLLTINALTAANKIIIPVQTEYYAMEGLGQLLQVVQRVRAGLNPELDLLGVLLTMYDARTSLSEQVKQEVQKHFDAKLLRTVIPRNVRLAEAPSHGKPISEHDNWSKGARAYKRLAQEVLQHG